MLLLVFIIAETFQPFLYSWRRTNQLFLAATGIEAAPSWQAQVLKFQRAFFPSFRWKKWCSSAVALRFGVWSYPGCACLFLLYPKRLISLLHLAATSTFVGIPPPHPSPFAFWCLWIVSQPATVPSSANIPSTGSRLCLNVTPKLAVANNSLCLRNVGGAGGGEKKTLLKNAEEGRGKVLCAAGSWFALITRKRVRPEDYDHITLIACDVIGDVVPR